MIKENIFLTKKSDKKIELVTKDILLDEGVYIFFELNPGLYVLQKKFTERRSELSSKEKDEAVVKEEILHKQKEVPETNTQFKPVENKERQTYGTYTNGQEWYKEGLELKAKLGDSFLAIEDPEEIRKISYVLKNEINNGEVLGIRGFDRTYYIFRKANYEKNKSILLASLKESNKTFEELKTKLNVPELLLKGLIELVKEQGEIIEPKKGTYKIVKG